MRVVFGNRIYTIFIVKEYDCLNLKYKSTCVFTQVLCAPGGAKDIGSSISSEIITQI